MAKEEGPAELAKEEVLVAFVEDDCFAAKMTLTFHVVKRAFEVEIIADSYCMHSPLRPLLQGEHPVP